MKCDMCKHNMGYATGMDEYPAQTYLTYCRKNHWEQGEMISVGEDIAGEDPWENCKDFEPKPKENKNSE
jgi:hypothetical protein